MTKQQAIPDKWELGDLLVAYLEQLGIDFVFGVPGGAIEPLYNALARSMRRDGPRPVVARHETGAAFMADGYARQTGKLGVCCATTGPGATNLITGVASAYENYIPMLAITAQTALSNFGRGALQESSCTGVNTIGMFQYCTRYNSMISHVDQFERKLVTAVMSAFQSPNGPVHLSIPLDLLRSSAPTKTPSYDLVHLLQQPSIMDRSAVQTFVLELDKAKNIVFVIGDGCNEATGTILELAMLINAPIVTTPHGKGLISPYHPLFRGVIGFAGHESARETLSDPGVDLIVAIGTGMGEWASNGWDVGTLLNNKLIHVDASEKHFARSPMAKIHVRGRIETIFEQVHNHFLSRLENNPQSNIERRGRLDRNEIKSQMHGFERRGLKRYFQLDDEAAYENDSMPIKPQQLMRELADLFPPNTRYLADSGNSLAWAIHYLHPFDRRLAGKRNAYGGVFRGAMEFASMGWAIGSSIGTALGSPGNPVVCIVGDGSFLMSGQEITVAIQERLPVIFVVLNDAALGMVKHGQRLAKAEPIAFELPHVDYCAVARAMGADGYIIRSPQDLRDLDIMALCKRAGPTLLDVRVDPEDVPPMKERIKVLGAMR